MTPTIADHINNIEQFEHIGTQIARIFQQEGAISDNVASYYVESIERGNMPGFLTIHCWGYCHGERDDATLRDIPAEWFDQFDPDVVRAGARKVKQALDEEKERAKQTAAARAVEAERKQLAALLAKHPDMGREAG